MSLISIIFFFCVQNLVLQRWAGAAKRKRSQYLVILAISILSGMHDAATVPESIANMPNFTVQLTEVNS